MTRKIEIQRPYRHFKGKLYYVHNIVTHTETEEVLVSYQALYPPYGMFVRPLDMFMEAGKLRLLMLEIFYIKEEKTW